MRFYVVCKGMWYYSIYLHIWPELEKLADLVYRVYTGIQFSSLACSHFFHLSLAPTSRLVVCTMQLLLIYYYWLEIFTLSRPILVLCCHKTQLRFSYLAYQKKPNKKRDRIIFLVGIYMYYCSMSVYTNGNLQTCKIVKYLVCATPGLNIPAFKLSILKTKQKMLKKYLN